MQKELDMTRGNPLKLLTRFGVPLFLANLCQELYVIADSAVVGRCIGVQAFAAIGAAALPGWLFSDVMLGFAQGCGVVIAQRCGNKDEYGLRRSVAASILLMGAWGLCLSIIGFALSGALLRALGTPSEIAVGARMYLRWMLGGLWIAVANRLTSTILMALGNSRTPLKATLLSGAANVLLDLWFVAGLGWGISGAAAATLLAQTIAAAIGIGHLSTLKALCLQREDFRSCRGELSELLRLGAPLGFRNGVISAGALPIQAAINAQGAMFVAGVTAAQRYMGFMQLAAGALEAGFGTYAAQNCGCGDWKRIRSGVKAAAIVGLYASLVASTAAVCFGGGMVRALLGASADESGEVLRVGSASLRWIASGLPFLYMLYVFRSGLEGMGNARIPMLSGFAELALRLLCIFALVPRIGRTGVYMADVLGWVGASLLLIPSFYRHLRLSQGRRT